MPNKSKQQDRSELNKPRVLLVDDDASHLTACKRQFRDRFDVELARNATEALSKLDTLGPFEVIVSDQRMPGMSGLRLLQEVTRRGLPVVRIMLTGHANQETAIAAVNDGQIFRFHTKPCRLDTLSQSITAAAEKYQSIAAQTPPHAHLQKDLRHALDRGEFHLVYQPQVLAATTEMTGVEALIRWIHPEHGTVSPEVFVPLLERSGMIDRVGEWVLRKACEDAVTLDASGVSGLHMAVNVSPVQLREDHFTDTVERVLAETGLPAERLEIELTESIPVDASDAILDHMNDLRSIGVRLAIDDFGAGYSALSYLNKFPVQKLKLDKSFVQNIDGTADETVVTQTVVNLAHRLDMTVIAEGVETADQFDIVSALGCDICQGYLFSAPMAAPALPDWNSNKRLKIAV